MAEARGPYKVRASAKAKVQQATLQALWSMLLRRDAGLKALNAAAPQQVDDDVTS